jgi:hypothetical protein
MDSKEPVMTARIWSCGMVILWSTAGCMGTCSDWWGRNSDGSHNWGKKKDAAPVQAGPIAGTYARPGMTSASPSASPNASYSGVQGRVQTPVYTTSPSAALQSPAARTGNQSPADFRTASGTSVPVNTLPPPELNTAPELKITPPSVQGPAGGPPKLDLTVPGTSQPPAGNSGEKAPATPLFLDPVNTGAVPQTPPPPAIEVPQTPPPSIPPPMDVPAPSPAGAPPPLPPAPAPPSFDRR